MVTLLNDEAGSLLLTESAAHSRFRPTELYKRILPIFQTSQAGGCTLVGSMGGLYEMQSETFSGADFQQFFGTAAADGTLDRNARAFVGNNGIFAPKGQRFGTWNGNGKVAGSAGPTDAFYVMGRWTRIAGAAGFYTNVVGSCSSSDYADVFEPWFGGPLP